MLDYMWIQISNESKWWLNTEEDALKRLSAMLFDTVQVLYSPKDFSPSSVISHNFSLL